MDAGESRPPGGAAADVRLAGFADLVPLERAQAWIDGQAGRLAAVEVEVAGCVGRTLAAPPAAPGPVPPLDRAGQDGYAVRSAETAGASAYDPALLRLQGADAPLAAGGAALVEAGGALPDGADAIAPFDAARAAGPTLEVIAPVAQGSGVERAGQQLGAGAPLAGVAHPLRPHEAALLASAGVERLGVVARPRVRLVVAGPKAGGGARGHDANGPMLRALIERDGGIAEPWERAGGARQAILGAAAAPGAELVIATGRTGTGADDEAPLALAEAGRLVLHGIALRPGGSTGMGVAGGRPVVLLPGDPLACLCAYELLAGRLVRGLGGRDPGLPHARCEAEVGRKIVSAVGFLEVCQVRLAAGRAEPLGVIESGGLPSAARADGFVLVPATSEGHPPGARVTVHLY
jgi:molybdopterin molybdotransferase